MNLQLDSASETSSRWVESRGCATGKEDRHESNVAVLRDEDVKNQNRSRCMERLAADLYQAMRPSLLGYVYQLLGPCNDAEDLVQMAFLKVFDQLRRNSQIENLRSWLYRVIRNLAIDEIRRKSKLQAVTGVREFNPDSVAGSLSTEKEIIQRQRIDVSLKILNKRERHCLILRAEGLSYKEISEVLTISPKAVSVYLARGVKKLETRNGRYS